MPMEGGGLTKKSNFFEGITLMDIGIMALVSLALFYSIQSSRMTITYIRARQREMAVPPGAGKTRPQRGEST